MSHQKAPLVAQLDCLLSAATAPVKAAQVLDQHWKEHLLDLDHLRQGIHLRGYAQRDPLNEYKKEAFELFQVMLGRVRESTTQILARLQVRSEEPVDPLLREPPAPDFSRLSETTIDPAVSAADESDDDQPVDMDTGEVTRPATALRRKAQVDAADPSSWGKVSRNAACPCGSGKKYKHCHGRS